jgi:hypothetical protein
VGPRALAPLAPLAPLPIPPALLSLALLSRDALSASPQSTGAPLPLSPAHSTVTPSASSPQDHGLAAGARAPRVSGQNLASGRTPSEIWRSGERAGGLLPSKVKRLRARGSPGRRRRSSRVERWLDELRPRLRPPTGSACSGEPSWSSAGDAPLLPTTRRAPADAAHCCRTTPRRAAAGGRRAALLLIGGRCADAPLAGVGRPAVEPPPGT